MSDGPKHVFFYASTGDMQEVIGEAQRIYKSLPNGETRARMDRETRRLDINGLLTKVWDERVATKDREIVICYTDASSYFLDVLREYYNPLVSWMIDNPRR